MTAANTQCHDAELALKMALHSYDRCLVADGDDTRSTAMMHAYHAHEALQEARAPSPCSSKRSVPRPPR